MTTITEKMKLEGNILIGTAMWIEIGYKKIPVEGEHGFIKPCPKWAAWKWLYTVSAGFKIPETTPLDSGEEWENAYCAAMERLGHDNIDCMDMKIEHHFHPLMQAAYNRAAGLI